MLLFGWCMDNQCKNCPGTIQKMWYEKPRKKRGETPVDVVVYGDDINCEHKCHTDESE